MAVPRVECRVCGAVRQVKIGFADSRLSYTRAFERYALDLSRSMTIKDVADHLGVSWDVIKEIQKRHLKRRFDKPKLKHLKQFFGGLLIMYGGEQFDTAYKVSRHPVG